MCPATRPRRPLPARVYWVRRSLVLAVAFGMVFGIAHLLGGTDSEPPGEAAQVVGAEAEDTGVDVLPTRRPLSTHDAKPRKGPGKSGKPKSAKTKTPPPEPSGPCLASDIVASPKVKGTAYAAHRVTFRVRLTTHTSPACNWRVSPSSLAVKLVSGSDRIWSSQDCPASIPTTDVVVRKDFPVKLEVHWRGQRSDSTCSRSTSWAEPGWYHVQTAAFGAEPVDEQFELKWPVRKTITPTPKPDPEKKSTRKTDGDAARPSDDTSPDQQSG